MSNDQPDTGSNTAVAATADEQNIERKEKEGPVPGSAPAVRPWTADFLLPSISFREPKPGEEQAPR
jgi:hypothetical protein